MTLGGMWGTLVPYTTHGVIIIGGGAVIGN